MTSTWVKGHHALNLLRRSWTRRDRILSLRFPARNATIAPASWVEELMAKRFGALIVCRGCTGKYRDGLRRWGYLAHADMKTQGNRCDFCKGVDAAPVPIWLTEEHRYPTQAELARQRAVSLSPFPEQFRGAQFPVVRRRGGSWAGPSARRESLCIR